MQVSGTGAKTIAGKLTNTTLTMNGTGTMGFTQQLAMEGGKLVVNSGTATLDQHNGATSQLKGTAVEVYGGGTIVIKHDAMGWESGTLASILLQGTGENNRAVMTSDSDTAGEGNTCSAALTLAGHALVQSTGTQDKIRGWANMTITATGTDNEISASLQVDRANTITVGDDTHPGSELKISGQLINNNTITKAGSGKLTLTGTSPTYGTWNLNAGTLKVTQSGSITIAANNTNLGTLEVAQGAAINLGNVSGTAKYGLAGGGTVKFNVTGAHYYLGSTGNEFNGTLDVTIAEKVFVLGAGGHDASSAFAEGYRPDLILTGNNGDSNAIFTLNNNYHGEDAVLEIGSLATSETSGALAVNGANGANPTDCEFRYLSVHQDTDTVFTGVFEHTAKGSNGTPLRSVGLMMNGAGATGGGTLTLTADNTSTAGLFINSGTVQLGEAGGTTGKWAGAVTVADGGQLSIQRTGDGALASDKTLKLKGAGVAAFTDAAGKAHEARKGALVLADDVTVANAVELDATIGASIAVGSGTGTISGALSGGTLTKEGAGTLSLTGPVNVGGMTVNAGTLSLSGAVTLNDDISSSGTVVFDGAALTVSADDFVNNRLDIVTGTGTTSGNFSISGVDGAVRTIGMGGSHVYLLTGNAELTWNGTAADGGDVWGASNWLLDGSTSTFATGDTVNFTADAANQAVAVDSEGVGVAAINVTGGTYSFTGGAVTSTGTLTLGDGATAAFDRTLTVGGLTMGENTKLAIAGSLAGVSSITLNATQTLELGGAISNAITLNGGTLSMLAGSSDNLVTVTADSTLHVASGKASLGADSRDNQPVEEWGLATTGNAVLTKTGEGTLSLKSKLATGAFDVQGGTLELASFDYLNISSIDLAAGTKLLLSNQWGSLGKTPTATDLPKVSMAGGSTIELRTGNNNTRFNADITVDATESAAVIRGVKYNANMPVRGTISGQGTLQFRALTDGTLNTNRWTVESTISDGATGSLHIDIADVTLTVSGDNTYSGGTTITNSSVTTGSSTAFGSGKLVLADSTVTLGADLQVGAISGSSGLTTGGHNISLTGAEGTATYSGAISGISLEKSGVGTQVFTDVGSLTGVSVTGGELSLSSTAMGLQNVVVGETGTLSLGGSISLADTISSSGTVNFADGTTFTVSADSFDGKYFDIVSGGTINLGDVTVGSFTVTGLAAEQAAQLVLKTGSTGSLYLSIGDTATLTWTGTESSEWGGTNWVDDSHQAAHFSDNVEVMFGETTGSKAVTVADTGVEVSRMEIGGSGYTFSGGQVSVDQNLIVGADVTASFGNKLVVTGQVVMEENATLNTSGGMELAHGIRVEGTRTLGYGGGTITGGITLAGGTLELADGASAPTFTLESDSYIGVAQGGTATYAGTITGAKLTKTGEGTLRLTAASTVTDYAVDAGTLQLTQDFTVNGGKSLTVNAGGTLDATGKTLTIASSNDTVELAGTATVNQIITYGGAITVSGGTTTVAGMLGIYGGSSSITGGTVTTSQLLMVDKDKGSASLTIGDGGKLDITGSAVNSFIVAGWSGNATGTLNVEQGGTVTAEDAVAQVSFWNGVTGTINVTGGSLTAKGISFVHSQTDGTSTIRRGNLNLSDGGEIVIGSEGIKGVELEKNATQSHVNVTLGYGTVKATDDWTMGRYSENATLVDVTLADAEHGTTFDTDGHNVTIDNNLIGEGALVKDGKGTLTLNGANTYTGDTTVKEGTLALGEDTSLSNGHMVVGTNGEAGGTIRSAKISGSTISGLDEGGSISNLKVLYQDSKMGTSNKSFFFASRACAREKACIPAAFRVK